MCVIRKVRDFLYAFKNAQRILEENETLRIQNTACGVKNALLEIELNDLKDQHRHLCASYSALRDTCQVYETKLQDLVHSGVLDEHWSLADVYVQHVEVTA